jgi:hypothetical protein
MYIKINSKRIKVGMTRKTIMMSIKRTDIKILTLQRHLKVLKIANGVASKFVQHESKEIEETQTIKNQNLLY